MHGWIKLHRKIRNSSIFNDVYLFRLAMICLTEAYHTEKDQPIGNQVVKIMPGEFPTGRFDLSEKFNTGLKAKEKVSEKTVWRWLQKLEKLDFLSIKSTNKFSVISIVNWHLYQKEDHQTDQKMSNKSPTDGQQMTTNKNVKNDKNEEEINKSSKSKKHNFEPVHLELAEYLLKAIKENYPDYKEPNLKAWAVTFRLMIDRDDRKAESIRNCIDWVSGHDFWHKNILSADKLRKQYDRLVMEAKDQAKFGVINGGENNEDHRSSYPKRDFSKYKFR